MTFERRLADASVVYTYAGADNRLELYGIGQGDTVALAVPPPENSSEGAGGYRPSTAPGHKLSHRPLQSIARSGYFAIPEFHGNLKLIRGVVVKNRSSVDVPSPSFADIAQPTASMGFFTWSVPNNLLFADEVFGDIYEFSPDELRRGIPVEAILGRIAVEHRAEMAGRVHATIMSGIPSTSQYDVLCPSGTRRSVVAFGRSFMISTASPPSTPAQ